MTSEWMKVMLEEIARKKAEAEAARAEEERRQGDVVQSGPWSPREHQGDGN
jgi:hypothetical protein